MTSQLFSSPIGKILLVEEEGKLRELNFVDDGFQVEQGSSAVLDIVVQQLEEYFAGKRTEFDLPIGLDGTAFQMKAWNALRKIPFGKTKTYGEQAQLLGDKRYARAVGGANGRNPISIIVPCHRVLGASGLGGYNSGLKRKQWLLDHESKQFSQ